MPQSAFGGLKRHTSSASGNHMVRTEKAAMAVWSITLMTGGEALPRAIHCRRHSHRRHTIGARLQRRRKRPSRRGARPRTGIAGSVRCWIDPHREPFLIRATSPVPAFSSLLVLRRRTVPLSPCHGSHKEQPWSATR